jgi:hypothetical protein
MRALVLVVFFLSISTVWLVLGREVGAYFGPDQSTIWFVASVSCLLLGWSAIWHSAKGREETSLRYFFLFTAAGLAFLSWLVWPGVSQERYVQMRGDAEMRIGDMRRGGVDDDELPGLIAAERDLALAKAHLDYERAMREAGRPRTHAGGLFILVLSMIWTGGAAAHKWVYDRVSG